MNDARRPNQTSWGGPDLGEVFMSDHGAPPVHRRGFLQTGAVASALGLATSTPGPALAAPDDTKPAVLPRRPLGKTGVDVTILNQGTWRSPDSLDRLLRLGHAGGVRYIDTAKSYGSEPGIARWFEAMPAGTRKDIFLVTKDHPNTPRDLIRLLDQRLASLKTDYVDLFFIHGIGLGYPSNSIEWPRSKELKETIEAIKKSGKARLVGFSCHDARKAEYLMSAAQGGFVDAIMVAYTPWLDKDAPLNRALDACHKAGIGLISMKQIGGANSPDLLKQVARHVPSLKEKGLSPYQGLLHAIWTDERIASCCVSMRNTDQLRENMHAARVFEPLKQAEMRQLGDAILAAGPTLCANCDGSCARAAGTEAALGDLARLYTYAEQYGLRGEARARYAAMDPKHRDWSGADLDAARAACPNRLNFAEILTKVDRHLA
jgi:predicted aldo/keto reductase-like oxidoreductase